MNKFHIISPCFNNQEYLYKCIDSIEKQDYPKYLIRMTIIDDFSEPQLNIKEVSFNLKIIKNEERFGPAYSRFIAIKDTHDSEIIIFLDGDDWLTDDKCIKLVDNIYRENNIHWAISNHKYYKNNGVKIIPTFVTLPLLVDKPKICHLRSGYGYVWNKMNIDWIKLDDKFIKWMTDWNENLHALKNIGQPYKIESGLCIYNQDSQKTRKENKNFDEMIFFFKNKFK